MKLKLVIVALLVVLVGVFYSVMSSSSGDDSKGRVLKIGLAEEPNSLDPAKIQYVWEARVVTDLYEGLVYQDSKGGLVPGVAKSWEISDDLQTYTFKLREDAKWSDGVPVTAGDFVFSLSRIILPKNASPSAYMLYWVVGGLDINKGKEDISKFGVTAPDDHTLVIKLSKPNVFFLTLLASQGLYPVPKHLVEAGKWKAGNVSNGPYRMVKRLHKQYIAVEKNPYYWDSKNVSVENINYYTQNELHTLLKRYRNKEIDILHEFDTAQIADVKKDFSEDLRLNPYAGVYYYSINSKVAKFKNVDVRKALSLAIDRKRIVSSVLKNTGERPAYGVVADVAGYKHSSYSWAKQSYAQRLELAKVLLEKAGYNDKNKLVVELKYNTNQNHKKIAIAIADMWKKLGVEVSLYNQDAVTHFSDVHSLNYEVARTAFIDDFVDPYANFSIFASDSVFNYSGYKSKEFDRLINRASSVKGKEKRDGYYHKAEGVILNAYYAIPIYYYATHALVSKNIVGYDDNALDYHPAKYFKFKD